MISIGTTNKNNMTKNRVVKERVYFFPPHLRVKVHHGGSLTGTQKGQEPGGGGYCRSHRECYLMACLSWLAQQVLIEPKTTSSGIVPSDRPPEGGPSPIGH